MTRQQTTAFCLSRGQCRDPVKLPSSLDWWSQKTECILFQRHFIIGVCRIWHFIWQLSATFKGNGWRSSASQWGKGILLKDFFFFFFAPSSMNCVILGQLLRQSWGHEAAVCESEGFEQSNKSSYFLSGRDVPVDFDRLTPSYCFAHLEFCLLFVTLFCSNNWNYFKIDVWSHMNLLYMLVIVTVSCPN